MISQTVAGRFSLLGCVPLRLQAASTGVDEGVIQCQTSDGSGIHHSVRVSVAGQASAPLSRGTGMAIA